MTLLELANHALFLLEETITIDSFAGNQKVVQTLRTHYPVISKSILRMAEWPSAVHWMDLTADTESTNNSRFSYMFQLPTDYIKFLAINNDNTIQHEIAGSYLYCDVETVSLKYIADITGDVNNPDIELGYDPLLEEAISYRLAAVCAKGITGNSKKQQELMADFITLIGEARMACGPEQGAQGAGDTPWQDIR